MRDYRILILGGYGRAGYEIADVLLGHTTATLTLAGRHIDQAEAAATQLNRTHPGDRVSGAAVNMTHPRAIAAAFARCDLVIVTVPFKGNMAQTVIPAAIAAGIDYIDINTDSAKHQVFARQQERIQHSQQIFLTEAGIIPGCPALMVRWAAAHLKSSAAFTLGALMRDPEMPPGSLYDMMAHAEKPIEVYQAGTWQQASPLTLRCIDFGEPQGRNLCVPVSLPELKALPEEHPIEALVLYQASINPVADFIFLLWRLLGLNRFPQGMAWGLRLFQAANRRFTRSPYGITLVLKQAHQNRLTLTHENVYRGTAIPVVAAVQQILAGMLPRPWQGLMGQSLAPGPWLAAVQRLGLQVNALAPTDSVTSP